MFATFTALSMYCFFTFIYACVLNKLLKLNPEETESEAPKNSDRPLGARPH